MDRRTFAVKLVAHETGKFGDKPCLGKADRVSLVKCVGADKHAQNNDR
jgi:hypothetical protein